MHAHPKISGLILDPKLITNTLTKRQLKHRKLYQYSKSLFDQVGEAQRDIAPIQSGNKTNTRVWLYFQLLHPQQTLQKYKLNKTQH